VGSSLFAQPLMLQAVPLAEPKTLEADSSSELHDADIGAIATGAEPDKCQVVSAVLNPETRAEEAIAALEATASTPIEISTLSDHLSLLRRWYYRPEKQRAGEVFFPREDSSWPIRRILRGAARMALGTPKPMAETNRELAQRNPEDEAQKPTRTKVLHEGRPDVERIVPAIDKAEAFKSRRKTQPR
jgi:excinuclease ABC subunit C